MNAQLLDVAPEVADALAAGRPVVALESTLITHGMPHPHNLQAALRQILRIKGVIRTETVLALHTHIPYRTEPLISRLAQGGQTQATRPARPPRAAHGQPSD